MLVLHYKLKLPSENANKVEEPKCDWNLATVKKMLNDEVYLGNIIYGKRHKVSFKSKKIVRQAREKWIIVENTHPALITREQWDNVHEKLSSRKRKRFDGTISMFAGLVYCDKCGYAMSLSPSKTQGDFYVCNTYKKKGKDRCSIHFIYYKDLCEIVRQDIQRHRSEIPAHIEKVITNGTVVNNTLKPVGNRMGYERTYYYNGEHYVVTGIGTNGYIVSAYPKRIRK